MCLDVRNKTWLPPALAHQRKMSPVTCMLPLCPLAFHLVVAMWLPELQPSQPHSEAGTSRASVKRPFVLSGSIDCSAAVKKSL